MRLPINRSPFAVRITLLMTMMLLSGCLSRKSTLPHRIDSRGVIQTDASTAPKGVRVSGNVLDAYAAVLGVPVRVLGTPALYTYIDRWMGTPHRTGGTDQRGIDCSAFVGLVIRDIYGKSLPRSSKEMAGQVKRKYERQLREGDLVFFSFGRRGIDHVGIYLHNHKFVHVSTSKGVIISDLKDPWYYKYFTRAGSVR